MTEETFRLPKSSYDELVKIIRAYGNAGNEATLSDVAHRAAIDTTIISRNNAFLISVGVIGGGKAKGITEKGRKLSTALEHQLPDEIASSWHEIVIGNDFMQKMVSAVSIRQGMEDSALQSHIAYSAGEGRNPGVMAGAGAVVEILKTAGLLKEENGKLVVVTAPMKGMPPAQPYVVQREPEKLPSPVFDVAKITGADSGFGVSIQIQIQCSASELSGLGPKLRDLLKELSKKEESEAEGQK